MWTGLFRQFSWASFPNIYRGCTSASHWGLEFPDPGKRPSQTEFPHCTLICSGSISLATSQCDKNNIMFLVRWMQVHTLSVYLQLAELEHFSFIQLNDDISGRWLIVWTFNIIRLIYTTARHTRWSSSTFHITSNYRRRRHTWRYVRQTNDEATCALRCYW